MKYRVNLTIMDYYDYVGTHPSMSLRDRVLESLPYQFKDSAYNLKFKVLRTAYWKRNYRVHFTVNMEESKLIKIFEEYKDYCHRAENYSYKVVSRTPKGSHGL